MPDNSWSTSCAFNFARNCLVWLSGQGILRTSYIPRRNYIEKKKQDMFRRKNKISESDAYLASFFVNLIRHPVIALHLEVWLSAFVSYERRSSRYAEIVSRMACFLNLLILTTILTAQEYWKRTHEALQRKPCTSNAEKRITPTPKFAWIIPRSHFIHFRLLLGTRGQNVGIMFTIMTHWCYTISYQFKWFN